MPRTAVPITFTLRDETKALAAAQIMLGLIHSALGTLWIFLFLLEDDTFSVGRTLMVTTICYLFLSGLFFINSGCSSMIQGNVSSCQLVSAIVVNFLSIFMTLIGLVIFGVEFPAFESIGINYVWSNMAGMMLLQISIISTISELIIAIIMVHWFIKACRDSWDESLSSSQSSSEFECD